nr:btb/poz domain [Pandoravirus massiliensis]
MDDNASATRFLRKMRHRLCDCIVRVRSTTDSQDAAEKESVVAHRAVLAAWPYFAALFRHTEPTAWEPPAEDDPRGAARPVYDIVAPFEPKVLCALVEGIYRGHENGSSSVDEPACDPVDAIQCAIYLGEKEPAIRGRIERVLRVLCDPADADRAGRDRDLATFVRHMIDTSLSSTLKDSLVARYHYLFDDAEAADAAERNGTLEMLYARSDPAPHAAHLYCDSILAPPTTHRLVRGTMCDLEIAAEFQPKVVDASQAVDIIVRPSGIATGMWQIVIRLFHPFDQVRTICFTAQACPLWTIRIRGNTESDVPSIVGPLTAFEIILSPVAPAF